MEFTELKLSLEFRSRCFQCGRYLSFADKKYMRFDVATQDVFCQSCAGDKVTHKAAIEVDDDP